MQSGASENAVDNGFINHAFLGKVDPFLRNLRGDKRFKEITQKARARCRGFRIRD